MTPPPPRPVGIQAILDELARAPAADSLDSLNRHLAARMAAYNTAPQPELGGLSPDQMHELLAGDWETTGALRVAADLSFDELQHVPFLADALTIMRFVATHSPVRLTARGNFGRATVAELVPALRMVTDDVAKDAAAGRMPVPPTPIRNEGDAEWLVIARHVLLFAKLLNNRKGLILSRDGKRLLDSDNAGVLYALIFRTFFRQFDLRFLSWDDRHSGLQATIAWSFCQLLHAPDTWATVQSLAARAWLDSARDPMTAHDEQHGDMRHHAFERRVLTPLVHFGIFERRRVRAEQWWQDSWEYRRTALFARVLRFEFHPPR